ncbi:MAG: hypothetical protein CVU04_03290 [Bacteroidetes bacterium HGW-Bacteroidetes-20]|nr:MAG: hypothetical protein CVU04_03290 [Bacteroidetes bacterium HGW-Bacteroidetes-20]
MNDKSQIIRNIKIAFGFKNDTEFAKYLGITPQTLASWNSRNMFNLELIYAKCENIDANYLLTGEGQMFRNSSENSPNKSTSHLISGDNCDELIKYLLKRIKDLEEEAVELKKAEIGSDDARAATPGSYKKTGG